MKLEIIDKEAKTWEPLKVTITLDSVEEARLLYHVCNRAKLKEAIFSQGYGFNRSNDTVANNFNAESAAVIWQEIETRGYKL